MVSTETLMQVIHIQGEKEREREEMSGRTLPNQSFSHISKQ